MDTPLADTVHKENVHFGGGKTTTMRKHIKLKPSGKEHKALADFRDTYAPSSGVSKDVDLKPMALGKQQIAGEDLFTIKNQIVNRAIKDANLNTDSVSFAILKMWIKPWDHGFSVEEIKQCYDWVKAEVEGMGWEFCSQEAEETFCKNQTSSETFGSTIGVTVEELERPILSDNECYKIDDPDLPSLLSFSGCRDTYAPSSGVSNDVDLKPMALGKQQIAGADLFTTNLNTGSVSLLDNETMWIKRWCRFLSDEDIKRCCEWAKEGIEQKLCCNSCSIEDEETFYKNQTLSGTFASAIGVRIAELEQPIQSDDEGYEIDDPDVNSLLSFSDEEREICALAGWA